MLGAFLLSQTFRPFCAGNRDSHRACVGVDGSGSKGEEMTMLVVVLVSLLGSAATESSPSEAVLRELHSKFAKYNKDLR